MPHLPATDSISAALLDVLDQVVGPPDGVMPLHEPEFGGQEHSFVRACIDSTFVSSVGKFVDDFELRLASYTGAAYAVAVVNGTAALQVALRLIGVEPGDEVIVPALSFVATANAVSQCGAVPHFVDSDPVTMGMAAAPLAAHLEETVEVSSQGVCNRVTGRRIAAIVPMHTFGHPVDLDPLLALAEHYGIPVVEDAAESLGSTYHGRHAGTFGQVAALSFNGNKIITTGGGGAILTNDAELAKRAKHLTTTAKLPHRWAFVHDEVAWNYRLPNLNAALGCAQMEQLPDFLERKRTLAARYQQALSGLGEVRFMPEPAGSRSNYWLNTVELLQPDIGARDRVLAALHERGYLARPVWTLLNELPMYRDCPRAALDVAERLQAGLLNLPSSPKLAR